MTMTIKMIKMMTIKIRLYRKLLRLFSFQIIQIEFYFFLIYFIFQKFVFKIMTGEVWAE
jgi:hypothetical protein